jgi:hypothetical protein
MWSRCWTVRAALLVGLTPAWALPAATARVSNATPRADVRPAASPPPALTVANPDRIGSDDVVGAKRAYIGGAFERRNIQGQEAGDWRATGRWPLASAYGAYDALADAEAFAPVQGADGTASTGDTVESVQAPAALGGGSGEPGGSRAPASVTSAMLVAGLGLLAMVARRRTLAR